MSAVPLDEQYLTWLYSRIGDVEEENPRRTYWKLFRQLYSIEFVWVVPNDDNRVEDGRDLRLRFLEEWHVRADQHWLGLGCSFLELLVGLAERLSFEAEGKPRTWFWELLSNLGLSRYNDYMRIDTERIAEVCDRVIWRTYAPDGQGGLFPLRDPQENQLEVEIWYQLCAYILEKN